MPWAVQARHRGIILLIAIVLSSNLSLQDPFVNVLSDEITTIQFVVSECDSYKSLRLHDDVLYVGGRDTLYKQNPEDISKSIAQIPWKVTQDQYEQCLALPQGGSEICHNYIRLIQPYNQTHILLCGTMALHATNIFLHKETGTLQKSNLGAPLCSYKPEESVTSVRGIEGGAYSSVAGTSRSRFFAKMEIVMNLPQSGSLLTSNGKGQMISDKSSFAFSFSAIDDYVPDRPMTKMYFVFGETVSEQYDRENFGTRIAQVCANDKGDWSNGWTSFLKVPLLCQTNEVEPFVFSSVTHSSISKDEILYGTFNTKSSLFRSGAVCAYRIQDIQRAFHVKRFWTFSENEGYHETSSQIPNNPSPGDCAYPGMKGNANATSKDFSPEFVTFMKMHPLVATSVTPIQPLQDDSNNVGPLLTRERETFTKIQVEAVEDSSGERYNVLFIGTDAGNLIKFVSVKNTNGNIENVELSEYKLNEGVITGLVLYPSLHQLYVQTDSKVVQVSTANCRVYVQSCPSCDPCRMCIASRDPSCAWDPNTLQCIDHRSTSKTSHLLQSVKDGDVEDCVVVKTEFVTMNPQVGSPVILGEAVTNPSITVKWYNTTSDPNCDIPLTDSSTSSAYDITDNQRLIISSFSVYDANSTFVATYWVKGDRKVGKQAINFEQVSLTLTPKTTTQRMKTTTRKPIDGVYPPNPTPNDTPNTENNFNTEPSPTPGTIQANSTILIIIFSFVLALVLIAILIFWYMRRSHRGKHNITKDSSDDSKEKHKSFSRVANPVSDQDKGEKIELLPLQYIGLNQTPPESDYARAPSPIKQDSIDFIDGPTIANRRTPPFRSKSLSRKDIQIKIADDEYKFRSIKRHGTRKTMLIEIDLPQDVEFDGEEVSHLESGYENVFGSTSLLDSIGPNKTSRVNEAEENNATPLSRNNPVGKLDFGSPSNDSDTLMKDSRLQRLLDNSRQNSPRQYANEPPSNKLLSDSYKRSTPLSSPRDNSSASLKPTSAERDSKSPTSTNSTSSTRSYQTATSSPNHDQTSAVT